MAIHYGLPEKRHLESWTVPWWDFNSVRNCLMAILLPGYRSSAYYYRTEQFLKVHLWLFRAVQPERRRVEHPLVVLQLHD
jgi:hypothetical protein